MSRVEWLKERKRGIGSSDAPCLLGLSPFATAIDVYNDKINPEVEDDLASEKAEMGRYMEPVIASLYSKKSDLRLRNDHHIRIHDQFPFLIANLDRIITSKNGNGPGILEIKNSSHRVLSKFEDNIPPYYFCQVQHQFLVTGYNWGKLVFLLDGWKLREFDISPDEEYINFLIEEEKEFWVNHVLKKVPPEPQTIEEINQVYKHSIEGSNLEATPETFKLYEELKSLNEKNENMKTRIEEIKFQLQMIMKNTEVLTFSGDVLATWRANKVERLDQKKLKEENPRIFEKYKKESSQRRFLLK